jgi:hypothetical protein
MKEKEKEREKRECTQEMQCSRGITKRKRNKNKNKNKNGSDLVVRPSLRWLSSALYIGYGSGGQIQRRSEAEAEAWRRSRWGGAGEDVGGGAVQMRQWSRWRRCTGEMLAVESDRRCTKLL